MHVRCCEFVVKFRICVYVYTYVTAALNECMEILHIQHMTVLIYNQVHSTKTFIFLAGGEWKTKLAVSRIRCVHARYAKFSPLIPVLLLLEI